MSPCRRQTQSEKAEGVAWLVAPVGFGPAGSSQCKPAVAPGLQGQREVSGEREEGRTVRAGIDSADCAFPTHAGDREVGKGSPPRDILGDELAWWPGARRALRR